jgi:hypothetical protein
MKNLIALLLCFGCFAGISASHAADFKKLKVTQAVNDVEIISAADQKKTPAAVNDIFTMPDILRTGPASRAELVADDETVTRVGANTIFSFDPANRTIDLKQGSLLFHSPHGQGGGTIHTASATASVLGSTLIVTTTPSGGFKVLALEDDAEIKFLNGLKQKLDPGQMTFVLPGGNQLAPIIIFRLDDLASHSLLVNGFHQQLSSMPLILHEIDKQLKLIKSGQASDTGLLAGDDANAAQVEVIDANTILSAHNSPAVNVALGTDATINQPSLTAATIPVPPAHVFLDQTFVLPGVNLFAGQFFSGFAARNISFNTPGVNPLTVDLSPYVHALDFDFVAANNMNIQGSTTFHGLSPTSSLFLNAGNQILIAPNITVKAEVADFELTAPGALTLDGGGLINDVGDIKVTSGTEITLKNDSEIQVGGHTTLTAGNAVNVLGTVVSVANATINTAPDSGHVTMTSSSDSVNVTGTSIQTHFLTINSGDGILLDGNGQTFTASGPGATANLTAQNTINLNNADFRSFAELNVKGNTVTVVNVNLPLITNVGTQTGSVNVNGPVTLGWFNVINSSWVNTPITSASQVALSSGPVNTPGVHSYAIGGL